MKKPEDFELKEWLCRGIVSLRIHYYPTGTDTSDTDWEMEDSNGDKKRVKGRSVVDLVDVRPDWAYVLRAKVHVRSEVEEWEKFAKKEAKDLREYKRLQDKFS